MIAPLLTGAGVKGKVNQAMKMGVPVVLTPIASEGMHLKNGVDALVGRTPDGLADHILRLYKDCGLWRKLVQGGYANLQKHFSLEAARQPVLRAFARAGLPPPTRGFQPARCTAKKPWRAAARPGGGAQEAAAGGGLNSTSGAASGLGVGVLEGLRPRQELRRGGAAGAAAVAAAALVAVDQEEALLLSEEAVPEPGPAPAPAPGDPAGQSTEHGVMSMLEE